MDFESTWYGNPTELMDELRQRNIVFTKPLAIPGYDNAAELKRGGQGVVYSAVQRSTKRRVAVKVLFEDTLSLEQKRLRFEREIDLVANLAHANIVKVFDSGVTTDDRMYFVMEYIEGVPFNEYVQEQRRDGAASLERDLRLFTKICDGVNHAHQRGVLHRDLKPSNILVDPAGEPHILDFGVAKPLDSNAEGSEATVTKTGHFLGTLAYASPEQVGSDPSTVDIRTDVYALGILLYEMLTGRPPYPIAGTMGEVIKSICESQPHPPSKICKSTSVGAIRRRSRLRMNDELDTIVLKALAKEPRHRYQSAGDLGRDILHYLSGRPIEAKRDSTWYLLKKTAQRHKLALGFASTCIALLIIFGFSMSIMYQHASMEAEKAKQINIFLEDTLSSVEPTRFGQEVTMREVLDEAVLWADIALKDQPEVEAALRSTIGNSYRNLGLYEKAEPQLTRALALRRRTFGDRHPSVAQSLNGMAMLEVALGHHDAAEALSRNSYTLRQSLLGSDHLDVAMSANNLAGILMARGDLEGAREYYQEGLEIRRKQLGEDHPDVAMNLFNLAKVALARHDVAGAEKLHRRALDIRRRTLPTGHPDLPRSLKALGGVILHQGRAADALPFLQQALEKSRLSLPQNHWRLASCESLIGACLTAMGRLDEAEALLLSSYASLLDTCGTDHAETQAAIRRLVELYEAMGKPQRVREYQRLLARGDVSEPG